MTCADGFDEWFLASYSFLLALLIETERKCGSLKRASQELRTPKATLGVNPYQGLVCMVHI